MPPPDRPSEPDAICACGHPAHVHYGRQRGSCMAPYTDPKGKQFQGSVCNCRRFTRRSTPE